MPITAPPTAPDRNDPATFSARADAFVAWLTAAVPQFNTLALATGPGLFLDGSAGAPSISFGSDTDIGFYRASANIIGVSVGGVQVGVINATGWAGDGSQLTGLNMGAAATGTLPIARGGTGGATASAARSALGLGSAAVAPLLNETDMSSNSATSVPSQASTKAYVDNAKASLPFTKEYHSSAQTITNAGLITLTHGLGALPKLITGMLTCVTAEAGYSVGDVIDVTLVNNEWSGAQNVNAVILTSTSVAIRFSSAGGCFVIANKATGVSSRITNANWTLSVNAYA